ncbi:hypothetical protein GF420_09410 [candidate division GN15 bacterium]|nr:hypothetical protein [candidate division GN15 bacterium]
MGESDRRTVELGALAIVVLLFILGRFFGAAWFDNGWSFAHWRHLPDFYGPLWIAALIGLMALAIFFRDTIGRHTESRTTRIALGLALLVIFWLLRFDHFAVGGGNVQVGEIAHTETLGGGVVVYRWFEFGITLIVHQLYRLLALSGMEPTAAGVTAWRLIGLAATAMSLVAAWKLALRLTEDTIRRTWLFCLIFFGGQTLVYFGYIGIGPVVVAVSLWFAWAAIRALQLNTASALLLPWLLLVAGGLLHVSLIYLLPAAVYVTLTVLLGNGRASWASLAVSAGVLILLIAALYQQASGSLELARQLLFLDGKQPFTNYGLFSGRHLGDFIQLLFLTIPLFIVIKSLAFRRLGDLLVSTSVLAVWLMAAGGVALVFVLDPVNSIPLDLPRFVAFLTPFGVLAALVLNLDSRLHGGLLLPALAAAMIALPFSYLPAYTDIDRTDTYVSPYVDEHPDYYHRVAIAFRDAYFYQREFQLASGWERKLSSQSEAFINLNGSMFLIGGGRVDEGLTRLGYLITEYPYWLDPRIAMARTQLSMGRAQLARPQIDSALMLAPYGREPLVLNYEYYRTLGQPARALAELEDAAEYYPADTLIITDRMLLTYQAGDFDAADSMATHLIERDSTHAHAWFVKGVLADRAGLVSKAIDYYERFLNNEPSDPDTLRVQRRVENLKMALEP